MKLFKFLLALIVTGGMTFILNNPITTESQSIPAVGKLLNPFSGFWQNAETVGSYETAQLNFSQLQAPVKVVYDDRLVPHVFAQNDLDAAFVQGYITAQHRLWQMDISERATAGRLSEILGPNALKRDQFQRRKGIMFSAENTLAAWKQNKEGFKLLEAYTDGVNAYIDQLSPKDYPVEFKLMGYAPTHWSPLKTAIFTKSMAESLCAREDDLEATNALKVFGRETFDFLFPEYNPKQTPIIPADTEFDFEALNVEDQAQDLISMDMITKRPFERPDPFLGSNNWAVDGSKTSSGNPILCSDPHLNLTLPSIWYEMQIQTPDANSYGVSLPGIGGVIIGFNENVAWGQTNVGHDVMDWYKIKWTDENKNSYLLDGKKVPVKWRLEEIKLKDGSTVIDSVKYTAWGPVVHDDPESVYADMALRWLPHDQAHPDEASVFTGLNKAQNFDDYAKVLKGFVAPAQNYVFASKEGDIAMKVNGRLPIKSKEQGRFVQDGSKSTSAWAGYIPMDQIPQMKNPERGFVSSANQHSTSPAYPYYYNGSFEDYRGRILNRNLEKMENITVEDMMKLQNSSYSLKAEEALPLLLKHVENSGLVNSESSIFQTLKDWDYNYSAKDAAPIMFELWYQEFYKRTWDEVYSVAEGQPMLYPESWRTIELLEGFPDHEFFDDKTSPVRETAKEIAIESFKAMAKEIDEMGSNGKVLEWATHRNLVIGHLGRIPAFNSDLVISNGHGDALNATRTKSGPSWRMIVELGKEVNAFGIYPGGQSGNPGSPFYNNMIQKWAAGEYYKINFAKNAENLSEIALYQQNFN